MNRYLRTKIRVTGSELNRIHKIANDNGMKMTEILRGSTLDRDFSRQVLISDADLYAFSNVVAQFDLVSGEAKEAIDDLLPSMSDKAKEMVDIAETMKTNTTAIISKLKKKREKVKEKVTSLMEENANSAMYDYIDTYENKNHDIAIPCTMEEIKEIRKKADEAGVTISCLLKTNAFEFYRYGTVYIDTGDAFPLVKELNAKIVAMKEILSSFRSKPTKNNVRDLRDIAGEAKALVAEKRKGITVKTAEISKEAKNIIKAAHAGGASCSDKEE